MIIRTLAALFACGALALAGEGRASWMKDRKWGVMTHYLADWKTQTDHINISVDEWNRLVDGFDVEALADQLHGAGASWYQISLGQNSGYYLAPNPTYERITGQSGKCAHRDLVSDLYAALHKRGIRLAVYLPSGAPNNDEKAVAALEWRNGPFPNREFQTKWEAIIRDWSQRWGTKVSAWWFDGCYFPNSMYRSKAAPNFESFAAAARSGNPDAALAFNPGVVYRILSMTPYEDFTAGEIDKPDLVSIRRSVDGLMDGVQIQMLSFLGEKWGIGQPRFTADDVIRYSQKVWNNGGAVTWDAPVELDGRLPTAFVTQLTALGKISGKH
ncbi:MAG: alpha-L-fucosidase [Bryobacteraceae bacterium]